MEIDKLIDSIDDVRVKLLLFREESKHYMLDELYPQQYITDTYNNSNPINYEGIDLIFLYFDDVIPSYKGTNKEYGRNLSRYYTLATARQLAQLEKPSNAEQYVLYIEQHYKHSYTRDLDNRNRKLLIDAIKYNHLLDDDNMNHLSIFECGKDMQPENEMLVFLIKTKDFSRFYQLWNTTKSETIYEEIEKRKIALKNFEKKLNSIE